MKYAYLILVFTLALFSCNNETTTSEEVTDSQTIEATALSGDKAINIDQSTIFWKGYKLLGNHTGKINLKEGNIQFKDGAITGGNFVVDMTSIVVTELMDNGEEEEEEEEGEDDKSDLAGHLMHTDFFGSEQFPLATFEITKSVKNENVFQITGNMTIKDITKEVSFDATLENNSIHSEIKINRTDFGIKYGSGSFFENLGDNVIKDEFDLIVKLALTD